MFYQFLFYFVIAFFAHCLADFPLQGSFLATEKKNSFYLLLVHCVIYAGIVNLALWFLGISSGFSLFWLFISHIIMDYLKCKNPDKYDFSLDQGVHIGAIIGLIIYPMFIK